MPYLLLVEFLVVEALGCCAVLALMGRMRASWARWLSLLILAGAGFGIAVFLQMVTADVSSNGTIYSPWSFDAGIPTFRFFMHGVSFGLVAFPPLIGFIGLRRSKSEKSGCKARYWSIGQCLGITGVCLAALAVTIACQDYLLRRRLRKITESTAFANFWKDAAIDDNAYYHFHRAVELARRQNDQVNQLIVDGRISLTFSPDEKSGWKKYFAANEEIGFLCDQAGLSPEYSPRIQGERVPTDVEDTDELPHWKMLGRYLLLEGNFYLSSDNPAQAYRAVARLRRLAEALARDGRYAHVLLAASIEDYASRLLERAINTRPPTSQEADLLKGPGVNFAAALDRAVTWCEFEYMARLRGIYLEGREDYHDESIQPQNPLRQVGLAYLRLFYATDDINSAREHFAWWHEYSSRDFSATYALGHGRESPWPGGGYDFGRRGGRLITLIFPAAKLSIDAMARAEARRRLADSAIDLTQDLPTLDLAKIKTRLSGSALRKDPFDDQPLRHLNQADGFVLYSIQADLEDNKGTEQIEWFSKGDITLCLGGPYVERRVLAGK
jgi:hypothetical protein